MVRFSRAFALTMGFWVAFATLGLAQNPNVTLTGTIQGPNGLPVANTLISITPTQSFFVQGLGSSSCDGYILQVNATTLACADTVNFNDTTPAAPTNGLNVIWHKSTSGLTDSVSAAIVGDGNSGHALCGNGVFGTTCTGSQAGLSAPSWISDYDGSPYLIDGTTQGVFGTTSANQVETWMFRLYFPTQFNTMRFHTGTWSGNPTVAVGVYDASGHKLFAWESIAVTTNNTAVNRTLGSPVILQPGEYYWACASSITQGTGTDTTEGGLKTYASTENVMPYQVSVVRSGTATNTMSAGVLPATLGTLSAGYTNGNADLPFWVVEP